MICKICQVKFIHWESGIFGAPMIWWEPTNCINDCYFCMVKIIGSICAFPHITKSSSAAGHTRRPDTGCPATDDDFNVKNKHLIKYPNIPSAICSVTNSLEVPIPSISFTSEDMD